MKVVLYLMDGHFHATRHADGCGVLARAQRAADGDILPGRGDRPQIWEEKLFARLSDIPALKDHACVRKAEA